MYRITHELSCNARTEKHVFPGKNGNISYFMDQFKLNLIYSCDFTGMWRISYQCNVG